MTLQFFNQDNENILNVDYDTDEEEKTIFVMQVHCPVRNKWILQFTDDEEEYKRYLKTIDIDLVNTN
ncbi:MAG: hypothetical protein IM336_03375 [Microcystis sp. M018S1]|uniref:hypothetical protein n=1 Tax=unclassified Microcystis TaxID=2643300 RepID=UPI00258B793C|nr:MULTISPECIES: hypothetical protein [unclassified Microcystis]MCA2919740.1 hypothetical protein [Microcystis sp. M017S1]MCA2929579.1 hypothetical protein [Microcystis sp. M018S1]